MDSIAHTPSAPPRQKLLMRLRARTVTYAALAAVLVLQLFYFLAANENPVFWRDEAATVMLAKEHWVPMLYVFTHDWKTYTHSLALTLWLNLVGTSELSARFFSLFACMGAVLFFFRGGQRFWGNSAAGLAMAALVGTSPLVLRYLGNDAAAYGFALFTSAWTFERYTALEDRRTRWRWMSFLAASFFMCNTQPVNFAVALALGLVWMRRRFAEREAGWWTRVQRAIVLPAAMVATAGPTLVQAVMYAGAEVGTGRVEASSFSAAYVARHCVAMLNSVAPMYAYVANFATDDDPAGNLSRLASQKVPAAIFVSCLLIAALAAAARRLWRSHRLRIVDVLIAFAATALFFTAGSLAMDRLAILFKSYSGFSPATALLAVLPLAHRRSLCALLVMGVLLRAALGLAYYDATTDGARSNVRDAARWIMEQEQAGDLIVLANTALAPTFSYYYTSGLNEQVHHPYNHPIKYYSMIEMYAMQTDPAYRDQTLLRLRNAAKAGRRVWFVFGGTPRPFPPSPWYSTADLPFFEEALRVEFREIIHRDFEGTAEPAFVRLYAPLALKAADNPPGEASSSSEPSTPFNGPG